MKIFREIISLPEFEKDLKKLVKRFRTLEEDLDNFIKTELKLYHILHFDNKGVFQISGLPFQNPKVFKAKKFACRALKGKGVHGNLCRIPRGLPRGGMHALPRGMIRGTGKSPLCT